MSYSFKVGDKVISPLHGAGVVEEAFKNNQLKVIYQSGNVNFLPRNGSEDGCQYIYPVNIGIITVGPMTLDTTIKADASELKTDDPILVRPGPGAPWVERHVARVDADGVWFHLNGMTSFTNSHRSYGRCDQWKLPEATE